MIVIFHHNDLDGRASAAIAYEYYKSLGYENIKFVEVDYTIQLSENITEDDIAIFLDYSFSSQANVDYLTKIIKQGSRVLWIDHHASSLNVIDKSNNPELMEAYEASERTTINIDTSYSATWLTFNYYKNCYILSQTGGEMPMKLTGMVPAFVRYVNSHDLWIHDMPETEEFVLGMDSIEYDPRTLLDMVYGDFNNIIFCIKKNISKYTSNSGECECWKKYLEAETSFINKMIESGKSIKRYRDRRNEIERLYSGFEFTIVFSTTNIIRVYKGLAMNINSNSLAFGDAINDYDVVCPFVRNKNGVWKYSLYTSKNDVDCSSIASVLGCLDYLGGGGHKKAAGFQTKTCIFDKGNYIHISPGKYNYKISIDKEMHTEE
jgi:oligoribonuclease NrnB/cAMP/cGMP phosphodiesterase (DHH superfamily)